ncbi:MAG: Panacea domain-containing protein [Acidimicrobiales bacterium]
MKLQKLLYYVQGWHLAWYGEPAFTEELRAFELGPVVHDVWRGEKYGNPRPESLPALAESHVVVVERVLCRYGDMTGKALADLSHEEAPWNDVYGTEDDVISIDALRAHFSNTDDADQGWFWDKDWQAGEREADADIRAGRTTRYDDAESFLDSLL